jgi:uncharacterized membrane protein
VSFVPKVNGARMELSRLTAPLAQNLTQTKFAPLVTTALQEPHYRSVAQKDTTSHPRVHSANPSAEFAKQATTASRTTACHASVPRVTSAQKSQLNPLPAALDITSQIKV